MTTKGGFEGYQCELVVGWPRLPRSGVASDDAIGSRGRAYAALRERPSPEVSGGAILVFDNNGDLLEFWGDDLYTTRMLYG
jgi:hypothetical protein